MVCCKRVLLYIGVGDGVEEDGEERARRRLECVGESFESGMGEDGGRVRWTRIEKGVVVGRMRRDVRRLSDPGALYWTVNDSVGSLGDLRRDWAITAR